jgi:hypothetical protein
MDCLVTITCSSKHSFLSAALERLAVEENMRVVQKKHVRGAVIECRRSRSCVRGTSAVDRKQCNRMLCFTANGSSVARSVAEAVQTRQSAGIQFLGAEGYQPADICTRMLAVYENSRYQGKACRMLTRGDIVLHVKARPQLWSHALEGWTVPLHPAPASQCDLHVFGPVKKALKGRRLWSDKHVKAAAGYQCKQQR